MEQLDLTNKYIKTYDNVLTKENCQHLIDKFEDSSSQWVKTDLDNHRHFTEINLNLHKDWQDYAKLLFDKCRSLVDKYTKDVKIDNVKLFCCIIQFYHFLELALIRSNVEKKHILSFHSDLMDLLLFLWLRQVNQIVVLVVSESHLHLV